MTSSAVCLMSQAPMPTIFESQELEDTVDNGDDDGECQKIWAGLQQGNLGRGACEHCSVPAVKLHFQEPFPTCPLESQVGPGKTSIDPI